jgi:hypothetical protein
MKNATLTIIFSLLMLFPASAQAQDLSGVWHFTDQHGTDMRIELSSAGNSWIGSSLSKPQAELKLNPAGLRNQWVGTLVLDGTHSVKADFKSGKLIVKDLDDGESWTLTREE